MELFKLLNFILHALPLTPQSQQLVLQFGVQLVLDVLVEILDLLALLFLCLGDLLNRGLNIIGIFGQLLQSLLEANGLVPDDLAVLLVNFADLEELMVSVLIPAKHRALRANWLFTCLAVVVQSGAMVLANLIAITKKVSIRESSIARRFRYRLVQGVDSGRDLLDKSAIDKLVDLKMRPTMWTLLPLLSQPLPDAIAATKFGARWTQDSVLDLAKANEALEDLFNVLVGIVLLLLTYS